VQARSSRFITAVFLSILFGTSNAAALPQVYNWNGLYIGGTVGGNWDKSSYTGTPTGAWFLPAPAGEVTVVPNLSAVSSGSLSPGGIIGGGELGYNWQVRTLVFGLEGDWSAWGLSRSSVVTGPGDPLAPGTTLTATTSVKSTWLATVRPRIGITNNNWLFYLTGGAAFSKISFAQSVFFNASATTQAGSRSNTLTGWTVGAGVEYALSSHWSFKGEYLYVTLPNQRILEINPTYPTFSQTTSNRLSNSILRFGVNYKFNLV